MRIQNVKSMSALDNYIILQKQLLQARGWASRDVLKAVCGGCKHNANMVFTFNLISRIHSTRIKSKLN